MRKPIVQAGDDGQALIRFITESARSELPAHIDFEVDGIPMGIYIVPRRHVTEAMDKAFLEIVGPDADRGTFVDPMSN